MKTFKLLSAFVFVLALATGFSYGQCCKSAASCQKTSVKSASAEASAPATESVAVKVADKAEAPAATAKAACCSKAKSAACTKQSAKAVLSAQQTEEVARPVKAIATGNKEQ